MVETITMLLTEYVLPLAVTISAAATTTTAVLAAKLLRSVRTHERALFGEEPVDGHDGIVNAVNHNTERSETNRQVIISSDEIDTELIE